MASRSNRARPKQIGRLWGFGCAGGGGARRRRAPAMAQRRRRPNSAFPGRIRAGLGSRSIYAACVSHWWRWRGCSGLGRGSWWSGAALARRRTVPGYIGCATGPKAWRKRSRGLRRAHLGSGVSSEGAQRRRRRSSAAAMAWWSRTGLTQWCSSSWVPRTASR